MSEALLERGANGDRAEPLSLPASVGGAATDIVLDGVAREEVMAWVGAVDGRHFVQPNASAEVALNGDPLQRTAWLHDGDRIDAGGSSIYYRCDASGLRLRLAARDPDAMLEPVPFQAPDMRKPVAGKPLRLAPVLAASLIAVLGVAAWYLFTARAVELDIRPAPDSIELHGALIEPHVGGRYLLRRGAYTVVAEKSGYRRSETQIEVGAASSQTFSIRLQKLPGYLTVTTAPVDDAVVFIDGAAVGSTPLQALELEPGVYDVRIEKVNYLPHGEAIEIEGAQAEQSLAVVLEPDWAEVEIASEPSGAELSVDGEVVGVTPLTAQLTGGERELHLRLPGYKSWQSRLAVRPGDAQTLPLVRLEQADGRVSVRSSPPGASVTVNGEYRGRTPLALALPPERDYTLGFSRAGFVSTARPLSVVSGEDASIEVTLEPELGRIRVTAVPEDAQVFVDGGARGGVGQTLELPAVPHRLEIRAPGYASHAVEVTPRPGFEQEIRVELITEEEARLAAIPRVYSNAIDYELRLLGGGEFRMGASRREPGRRANEVIYPVKLTRPFYLGTHEVTNAQFRLFDPKHSSGAVRGIDLNGDDQPVVRVTWQEAAKFCNWLSARESLPPAYVENRGRLVAASPMTIGYRLPTEAEWSWAVRHGAQTGDPWRYPWGDSMPPPEGAGNFADQTARRVAVDYLRGYQDGYPATAPVGSFPADRLGLRDTGGNVAEWIHDYYGIYTGEVSQPVLDPMGPADGELRVIRGASYLHGGITELRTSFRDYSADPRPDVGFRLARYVDVDPEN